MQMLYPKYSKQGICNGDSGGPYVVQKDGRYGSILRLNKYIHYIDVHCTLYFTVSSWTLVGVVSASSTTLLGGKCGDPDSVGLAMSVAHFLDIFIRDNIVDGNFCQN